MITIEDFWRIDDQIEKKWAKKAYQHIDYCGLEPVRPLMRNGYFCTPSNSMTFARTGGDGVHFGFLTGNYQSDKFGPIVMTVPMARTSNVVVAEDLDEFFSIGYYVGWFALEQIVYDLEEAIRYFAEPDPELSRKEVAFLELIRKELHIRHIPLSKARLNELEKAYLPLVEVNYQ